MYKQIQIKSIMKPHEHDEEVVLGKGGAGPVICMTIRAIKEPLMYGCKPWILSVWMADTEEWATAVPLNKDDRARLYQVSWRELMDRESIQWLGWEWNHAALRALLLTLAATHKKDFSEFTLDMQNDRWWHESEPLDAEPCGPYVPRVTDAPRPKGKHSRRSPKPSDTSSGSSAPSPVTGLNNSNGLPPLRPRTLFRTSRLSEEEPRKSCAPRLGCRSMPHHIVDGDYATMGDGTLVELQALMRNNRQWGWGIEYDLKEPRHFMEDDQGLPLEPAFPISPMMQQEEPVTPIYLE